MKWRGRRTSTRIEDRRGGGGMFGGLGGGRRIRLPGGGGGMRGRGMKVGGIGAIAILVIGMFLGIDPGLLLGLTGGGGGGYVAEAPVGPNRIDDETEEFVAVVLADTEEVWTNVFAERNQDYAEPTLVLFSGAVRSACGTASSAVGPFYCPGDRKAYLDTDFFRTLSGQLGAGGDFAAAYVIAHEVAHHVQNLWGILPEVNAMRQGASETAANQLSVRLELQADCLSGVWARRADARFQSLEDGDIEEAMNAAARIGDDALQRRSQGTVVPDSFTHGSSAQRVRWFRRGYEEGDPNACDTFNADQL